MSLAELIARESGQPLEAILLLRHSNESIAQLRRHKVTVEEYTAIQPIGSKYDYYHPKRPRINLVAAIVNDRVYQIYRVAGVEQEGTNLSVASDAYKQFDRDRPGRACRRFQLRAVASVCTGLAVHGWEGRTRTPVQRKGDAFFDAVEIHLSAAQELREAVEQSFDEHVAESLRDSSAARRQRLARADHVPRRVAVTSYVFARNPDVVAEVLVRAAGVCERCRKLAPFLRRADKTPYLEVHHRVQLARDGEDTVENAIALCPNCHREEHFG